MIKSKAEIDTIRKACEITSKAFEKCFDSIEEGMSEREVAKILYGHMLKEGADRPHFILMASGPYNYHIPTGRPTNFTLKNGNILQIDAGCTYNGHSSDFARLAVVGAPSNKQRKMHELACNVNKKCVGAVKPGIKAHEIFDICNDEFRRAKLDFMPLTGRIGHGLGLSVAEPPHIASYDTTILKPGMVITIEPGIITDYGNFTLEDDVVVTEDGHEVLSKATRELRII